MQGAAAQDIARIAALDDPTRRRVYEHVASSLDEVTRDEVAETLGISRSLAAFHLERLVRAGLLAADYRRLGRRTGPGAGRPSKLYRRATGEVDVSLPPRQYLLLARLLTHAIAHAPTDAARDMLGTGAERLGLEIGQTAREGRPQPRSRRRSLESVATTVRDYGFEPVQVDGRLRLRNCPFHPLAREHPETVCAMNLCLMKGLTEGLKAEGVKPVLEPEDGFCCVVFERSKAE